MKNLYAPHHLTRLVLGTVTALVLLAAMSAVAAAEPASSDHFVPGWQAHAKPLFNLGPAVRVPGRDRYAMPGNLAHGDYVLVQRKGDKAELLDTSVITVRGGIEDHYIFLEAGLGQVEALPVADVPLLKTAGMHPSL